MGRNSSGGTQDADAAVNGPGDLSHRRKTQILLHDSFNIGALGLVVSLVGYFLYTGTDTEVLNTLLSHYWNKRNSDLHLISALLITPGMMDLYYIIFYIVSIYLVVDCLWVLINPRCVPSSPGPIVIHHIATAVLLGATYFGAPEQYAFSTAIYLTVEANTIILVTKRNVPMGSLLWKVLDIFFYATWVIQRLIQFPLLVWWSSFEYLRFSYSIGTHANMILSTPIFSFVLTILSYKWTVDLLSKKKTPKATKTA